jgi:hypothetical protein
MEGKRLDKPPIVSLELYSTMIRCWTEKPEQRPSFSELVSLLETDEAKNNTYIDITTIQSLLTFPPTEEAFNGEKRTEDSKKSLLGNKIV